jgi:hypothetical protein
MQATKDRESDDLAPVLLLLRRLWRAGEALVQALVRPGQVEIDLILLHDLAQMAPIENEKEIEAFPPHAAQKALANGVGFGLSWPSILIRSLASGFSYHHPKGLLIQNG